MGAKLSFVSRLLRQGSLKPGAGLPARRGKAITLTNRRVSRDMAERASHISRSMKRSY